MTADKKSHSLTKKKQGIIFKLCEAIKSLTCKERKMFNMDRKKISVSTVGVIPKIYQLAEELPGINLAISFHASNFVTNWFYTLFIKLSWKFYLILLHIHQQWIIRIHNFK